MHAQSPVRQAIVYFQAGRFDQAEALCREVLKQQRNHPEALHLLGALALQSGKPKQAIKLIEKAIRADGKNAAYLVSLGEAYRLSGRDERALSLYERALALDPRRAEAHCGLGNAFLAQDKPDEALASYERALELAPNLAQAHYNKGNLLSQRGDAEGAIAAYEQAIASNPAFGDAHYNLGNLLSRHGELAAAAEAFERAVAVAPGFAKAHYNRGNCYRKLGRLAEAKTAYKRALEIDSGLTAAHLHLGTLAKLEGRPREALAFLNLALELNPDLALAHAERGHVLLLQRETEAAIAAYRRAVELDPDFAWGHMGLSGALAAAGQVDEAKSASGRAVRLRRRFEWAFLGQRPVGRVVTLKGVEDGHFIIETRDQLRLIVGMNSTDEHIDRTRFALSSFYVDGLESGRELDALPDCDVIFNAISDPDAMPASLEIAARIARAAPVPVVNHPDVIAQTQRHRNYEALRDVDGLVFPRTIRVDGPFRDLDQVVTELDQAGIGFPVLVRRSGTHTGESLEKVETAEQLWAYLSVQALGSFYITEFHDFAGDRGTYAKMRMFFVDGQPYPVQCMISDGWLLRSQRDVQDLMLANDWMMEEATRFCGDPEAYLGRDALAALASVPRRLPLDIFGVDFACLPDGRLLVFEANAVMRLPLLDSGLLERFSFRKPAIESIEQALQGLLERRITESKNQGGAARH